MAGMFVTGNSLFATIGLGTMIVVLAAMVGSLTVLPAVLSRLGDKVDLGRVPFFGRGSRDDGRWARFIGAVLRRPWPAMLVSGLIARPRPARVEHAHQAPEPDRPPAGSPDRADVRAHPAGLPRVPDPAVVVVKAPSVDTPQMRRAYDQFRQRRSQQASCTRPSPSA